MIPLRASAKHRIPKALSRTVEVNIFDVYLVLLIDEFKKLIETLQKIPDIYIGK